MTWVQNLESHLGQLTFSLKRRESKPSQLVVLCCLALFDESLVCNHVYIHIIGPESHAPGGWAGVDLPCCYVDVMYSKEHKVHCWRYIHVCAWLSRSKLNKQGAVLFVRHICVLMLWFLLWDFLLLVLGGAP